MSWLARVAAVIAGGVLLAGCATEPLEKDRQAITSVMKLVRPEQFGHISNDTQKAKGDAGAQFTQRLLTVDVTGTPADVERVVTAAMGAVKQCDSRGTTQWSCLGERERINVRFTVIGGGTASEKLQVLLEATR